MGVLYIPLDSAAPIGRTRQILEDAKPDVILCGSLETIPDCIRAFPVNNLPPCPDLPTNAAVTGMIEQPDLTGEEAAYLFYTSGSTGKPKGIVGKLSSLDHFAEWEMNAFGLDGSCRVSQFTSPAFDAFLRDVLTPLCAGGTICIPPRKPTNMGAEALWQWIEDQEISLIHCVPSLFSALLEGGWKAKKLTNLKHVLLAGEAIPLNHAADWLKHWEGRIGLTNLYGSTETTMVKLFHPIRMSDLEAGFIPAGKPMTETETWVLDEDGNPCEPGQPGEIYVATPHRTLGYFKGPGQIESPFTSIPQTDIPAYPTGDVGMMLPDGNLRLMGRRDRQLKVGGVRIEPEEVERAMMRIPGIHGCAVALHSTSTNRANLIAKEAVNQTLSSGKTTSRLTAFLVTDNGLTVADIRQSLDRELPAAAIPQRFLRVPRLPRNTNGKTDYRALVELTFYEALPADPLVPVHTETEKVVARIWSEVLNGEAVGRESNFFFLGGDSLKAMQVINRLRKRGPSPIQATDLLQNPVLQDFCKVIDQQVPFQSEHSPVSWQVECDDANLVYPLTPAQEGLWFLWKMDPQNPYYTCQGIIHIRGQFDLEALEKTWNALQLRHEILRVRLSTISGNPVQKFTEPSEGLGSMEDLSHLGMESALRTIRQKARIEGEKAFDLEKEALVRSRLYRISEEHHALQLTMHEITVDLWGIRTFMTDFSRYYAQALRGESVALPPQQPNFRQYLRWQAENPGYGQPEETFWKGELSGELPVLNLPVDRPRNPTPSFQGRTIHKLLGEGISTGLHKLSRDHGNTLYVTLLSGFFWLLQRYTDQRDILVGSPLAQRTDGMNEHLMGFFLNMLPLRQQLDPEQTVRDLLEATRNKVNSALKASNYPFSRMLEWASSVRDTSTAPVFQVMFNMLSYGEPALEQDRVSLSYESMETGYTKYDLSLYAQEYGDRIFLQIAYQTELFNEETVGRILENLETLFQSMVEQPGSKLTELDCIHPAERKELLTIARGRDMALPASRSLIEHFEEQVLKNPDATALVFRDRKLSYEELDRMATQLAHVLAETGIENASPVAIRQNRSFHMVAAILAAMKRGIPFVFLDPDYPDKRNQQILKDADARILITDQKQQNLPTSVVQVIWNEDEIFEFEATAREPAYRKSYAPLIGLVYTSGSTGKPKGVRITQESLLNRFEWMWQAYPFSKDDVMLLQKSMSLVASSWECLGGLLKGIPTVIARHEDVIDPTALAKLCDRQGVSRIYGSPALFKGVLFERKRRKNAYRHLRLAFTSAEEISPSEAREWGKVFPDVPLYNLYGSTECSSNAMQFDCRDLGTQDIRVPLGHPLPNIQAYVLDKSLRLLPKGAVGQLCIGGACLADGYWKEEETATNNFSQCNPGSFPDTRLYMTGDLARIRADNQYEFLGRRDSQIKLRGFRIEPAEIENTLQRLPEVEASAVTLVDSETGPGRLAAFIVSRGSADEKALRKILRSQLPSYMIPEVMVFLESLPRTAAGKVDRASLKLPAKRKDHLKQEISVEEENSIKLLTSLWQEQLNRNDIAPTDNFFDLGGHSLMASRMFTRIGELTGKSLPVSALFQAPTIEALAARLEETTTSHPTLVSIREAGDKIPLICVSPWDESSFCFRHLKDYLSPDRPIYGLEQTQRSAEGGYHHSLSELVSQYHSVLKTNFQGKPVHLFGFSGGGVLAWELAARLAEEHAEVRSLILLDTSRPGHKAELSASNGRIQTIYRKGIKHLESAGRQPGWGKLNYFIETAWMKWQWHFKKTSSEKMGAVLVQERQMEERRQNFKSYTPTRHQNKVILLTARQRRLETIMDPSLGWNKYAAEPVKIYELPGNHNTMLLEPHVRSMCRRLDTILSQFS